MEKQVILYWTLQPINFSQGQVALKLQGYLAYTGNSSEVDKGMILLKTRGMTASELKSAVLYTTCV